MKSLLLTFRCCGAALVLAWIVPLQADVFPVTDGLVLRLEADEGVGVAGGIITHWQDASGRGNHLTALGQPSLAPAATPSGRSAVWLDGVDDQLERQHATHPLVAFPTGSQSRTLIVVARYHNASTSGGVAYGTAQANRPFGVGVKAGSGELMLQTHATANSNLHTTVPGAGAGWLVQTGLVTSNQVRLYLGAQLVGEAKANLNTVPHRFSIGQALNQSGFLRMEVAAVLLFDRALSETERTAVQAYLEDKYITLRSNSAPVVTIVQPPDGAMIAAGQAVTLTGIALDREEGDLSPRLAWASDRDQALGQGASLTTLLTTGEHVITASVSDSGGLAGVDSIAVTVQSRHSSAPLVSLASLPPSIEFGQSIEHLLAASDPDEDLVGLDLQRRPASENDWASVQSWTFAPSPSATRSLQVVPAAAGSWQFRASAVDAEQRTALSPVTEVAVSRTTPLGLFADRLLWPASAAGHVLAATDLNAAFVNPYSGTVASPSGNVSYSTSTVVLNESVFRMNAGGDAYTSATGLVWAADSESSSSATLTTAEPISNTTDPQLYQVARVAANQANFTYLLAVPVGDHVLRLRFAEISSAHQAVGARVFKLRAQGQLWPGEVDVYERAGGGYRACYVDIPVRSSDGQLSVAFEAVVGPPLVSAVEVISSATGEVQPLAPGVVLPVGLHRVIATIAADTNYQPGEAAATFAVTEGQANRAPTVTIATPADGSRWAQGAPIAFSATAMDPDEGDLSASIAWTSSLDGPLGSGATVTVASLAVGSHQVTASVVDSGGMAGEVSLAVIVEGSPGNTAPTLAITSPQSGFVGDETALLLLQASVEDAEDDDAALSAAIEWRSNQDGLLGTGASLEVLLTPGEHVLTAQVVDSGGLPAGQTVAITILPASGVPAAGLVLHLDAEDELTTAAAGDVFWEDRSGAGNHLYGVGSPQRVIGATPAGGAALRLMPGNAFVRDHLLHSLSGLPQGGGDRTLVLLARFHVAATAAGFSYGATSAWGAYGLVSEPTQGRLALELSSGSDLRVVEAPTVGAGWHVQVARHHDGVTSLLQDGVLLMETPLELATGSEYVVLGRALSGEGYAGLDVVTCLIYNRALTDQEIARLATALRVRLEADGDEDADGLPDGWERVHFGDLEQSADDDFDDDGLSNGAEWARGLDPGRRDSDGDGMPDGWEVLYELNPFVPDAVGDPDGDSVTNLDEYRLGRNPRAGVHSDGAEALNLRVFQPL